MLWSSIIKSLIQAAIEYLKLRTKSFYLDLFSKSYERQDGYIKEVENLRSNTTPANLERINILMLRLQQERARLDDISTFYVENNPKSDN